MQRQDPGRGRGPDGTEFETVAFATAWPPTPSGRREPVFFLAERRSAAAEAGHRGWQAWDPVLAGEAIDVRGRHLPPVGELFGGEQLGAGERHPRHGPIGSRSPRGVTWPRASNVDPGRREMGETAVASGVAIPIPLRAEVLGLAASCSRVWRGGFAATDGVERPGGDVAGGGHSSCPYLSRRDSVWEASASRHPVAFKSRDKWSIGETCVFRSLPCFRSRCC